MDVDGIVAWYDLFQSDGVFTENCKYLSQLLTYS